MSKVEKLKAILPKSAVLLEMRVEDDQMGLVADFLAHALLLITVLTMWV